MFNHQPPIIPLFLSPASPCFAQALRTGAACWPSSAAMRRSTSVRTSCIWGRQSCEVSEVLLPGDWNVDFSNKNRHKWWVIWWWFFTEIWWVGFVQVKQGNQLTRRPCKGDKFEVEIFEAKRRNAGICGTCQTMFATWTFISIGRRVTQVSKIAFRLRNESILLILFFEGWKKIKYPMQTSTHPCLFSSRSLSAKSAFGNATATDSNKANQGDITTPCPAISLKVPFLSFFVHNGNKFRGPCEMLVKNVITPPPDDHKRACATCLQRQQVPWAMYNTRQERYHPPHRPPHDHKRACATC